MKIESDIGFRPRVIGIACLYLILATAGLFLAFCNLDGRLFWADEAENAVLARNILKFGVPKVDDGVNHISLHGDRFDARDGLWTWSPWLPEYVTAASFAVFGQTTWAGRAPFAFIGWLTVAALGAMTWKMYKSHRVTIGAMLLLGTSEVFLLHIRQCRYYSITVFAEILLLYGIYQILTKTKSGPWLVLAGLTLQFYCNYTIAAANIPLLLVLAWNSFRQNKTSAAPLLVCLGIFFVISAPWLVFSEVWRQGSAEPHDPWTKTLRFYLVQFHFHFFPWCIILLPAYGWLAERFGANRHVGQASCLPVEAASSRQSDRFNASTLQRFNAPPAVRSFEKYLILLPFLYVPVLFVMSGGYLRYMLPVLPALCLLVAAWLFRYVRWTAVAVLLLMFLCLSNVFAVATDPFAKQYPIRSPFADFVFGSLLPYQDRFTDVLNFFQKRANPGDTVVSDNPEFPLMFYTRLKIVNARLSPFPLHPLPRWILPVSLSDVFFFPPAQLPDNLKPDYEKITLTVHDSPRVDNMPEPDFYQSLTAKTMTPFVIYERKP
ncbi:MAG TPA: glycosyltransferase family 39 protein [Candidatus Sulfotelmatobacter sp.]|nr:glycosyltransferase family 39 protein [Candidatus Sulfotelmatobacter sp.]